MCPIRDPQLGWLVTGCLFVGGCAASGLSPLHYGVRQIRDVDRMAAFDAVRAVLVDFGYQIDRADPGFHVIATRQVLKTARDEPFRSAVRLSTRSDMRRMAQVRIAQAAEALNVYCHVLVQEQITETHRILRHELVTSDRPGETPIDREAATTRQQNTVWRTVRRDKAAQRRILQAIVEQTGGAPE